MMNKMITFKSESRKEKGFTLLELLVVIGIIGILVAIGTISYTAAQSRGRDSRRKADLENIAKALEQYYGQNNVNQYSYPADADCTGLSDYLAGDVPTDPKWGFEYTDSTANNLSGGSGAFCEAASYCVCVELEATGTGNAYGRSGTTCTFSGAGSKDYFCVQSRQ